MLENREFITADLWGAVRRHIDKKFGKAVHVLALCAAAGDQAPRDIIRRARNTYEPSSEEWMDEIAQRIVFAVMSKYEEAKDSIEKETVFIHEVKELMLPIRKIKLSDYQRHKNTADMLLKNMTLRIVILARERSVRLTLKHSTSPRAQLPFMKKDSRIPCIRCTPTFYQDR